MIRTDRMPRGRMRSLMARPARSITVGYLLAILVGTLFLLLPVASAGGQSAGLLKASFTATSAVCVTGLVVADTATQWSLFGQLIILALIQVGGLGIVTITSVFFMVSGRRLGLKNMLAAQESTGNFSFIDVRPLLGRIVLYTFTIEIAGAVVLATQMIPVYGWGNGLYRSVFHAVSAFCNAGFDVMGSTASGPFSSFTAWNGYPFVTGTLLVLLILGGIGFIVMNNLMEYRKNRTLTFHTRVVLLMTGILLLSGGLFYFLAEYTNTTEGAMGSLPAAQRPLAALFQSATPRTAGFNTLDTANLTPASKVYTILMMFIGASPGSTGGGIKVTTFIMLLAAVLSELRGHDDIVLMRHRVSRNVFSKAFLILSLGIMVILVESLILAFTEQAALAQDRIGMLDLIFEAGSAFGTVGLSAAGTPSLTPASWISLMPVMLIGRVGPVMFAISLLQGTRPDSKGKVYPEGRCVVG